jgi:diguanylate cyclase (GGDEF)-like protein
MRRLFLIAICCFTVALTAESDRVRTLLTRGETFETAGRLDEAARDYAAARAQAEREGDRQSVAKASASLGYLHYYRGEMNEALVDLRSAYEIYDAVKDVQGRRQALENIAHVYADTQVGQFDRAIEYYQQLLAEHQAAGTNTGVADTLYNIGSTYEQKGDPEAALEWFRQSLAAEEKLGRREEAASVKRSMGVALGKLGRLEEALPPLDDALHVFVESRNATGEMQVRQSRGIVLRKLGRLGAAIDDLETTRAFFTASKNTRFLEKTQDELALAYMAVGRWDDAYRARTAQAALEREMAATLREDQTTRLRVQFDSEKKEQENRALIRESIAAARIRRLQTVILILGAVTILVLVYLAFRLRSMAMTDELTRLPNRRRALALADRELQHARTTGETFSLLAIDIDDFKTINDTWGHAAGDLVLQRVAQTCGLTLRPRDFVGRVGGEEFLAVLPATTLAAAQTIAEQLRSAVERIDLAPIDAALRVTISIGLTESARADEALANVVRRADELLYRAKQRGRNRVDWQEPPLTLAVSSEGREARDGSGAF